MDKFEAQGRRQQRTLLAGGDKFATPFSSRPPVIQSGIALLNGLEEGSIWCLTALGGWLSVDDQWRTEKSTSRGIEIKVERHVLVFCVEGKECGPFIPPVTKLKPGWQR